MTNSGIGVYLPSSSPGSHYCSSEIRRMNNRLKINTYCVSLYVTHCLINNNTLNTGKQISLYTFCYIFEISNVNHVL